MHTLRCEDFEGYEDEGPGTGLSIYLLLYTGVVWHIYGNWHGDNKNVNTPMPQKRVKSGGCMKI